MIVTMPRSVLFIAGLGRSGSTLLARLLGGVPGVFNAGECVLYLFTPDMYERRIPCSCSLTAENCPFWGEIARTVTDSERIAGRQILRIRRMLPFGKDGNDPLQLRRRVAGIYADVAERSGAELIVDSSKHPSIAQMTSKAGDVRTHVLHLVRDPRAVVASRLQPKSYLRAINPGLTAARWDGFNVASEGLRGQADSYRRVRYEDFIAEPAETLKSSLQDLMELPADLSFLQGRTARLGPQHALAGNPDKLQGDVLEIRESSYALPTWLHWMTTAITLPLLRRYGYPLRPTALV
jgi:hypothetical protein